MIYFILKKYFKFLIDDFDFKYSFKQKMGYIQLCYVNSQIRITILGQENIHILISDVNSLGTYADVAEFYEEFMTRGNYYKKARIASQWLKEKLREDYCF